MASKVWVSSSSAELATGSLGPGKHWEEVGTVTPSQEPDLWKQVQTQLGQRSTPAPSVLEFYIDGDPDSLWVQYAATGPDEKFWVAIDVFGDGTRYLISAQQAVARRLSRRLPEAHPGAVVPPTFVGMRLRKSPDGLFAKQFQD